MEVYREQRPADAFKRDAADARAEAEQCRAEKTQLLSERSEPGGLMGAAWLEQGGTVSSTVLHKVKLHPASALLLVEGKAYSYAREKGAHAVSLSVRLRLSNPGVEPWTTAGAALLEATGEQVDLAAFQPVPILFNGVGAVVVGTERDPGQIACPCTLKLWESPGARVFTVGNVRFPDGPKTGR